MVALFSNCEKNDPAAGQAYLSAKVNGKTFNSTLTPYSELNQSLGFNLLSIAGVDDTNAKESIAIVFTFSLNQVLDATTYNYNYTEEICTPALGDICGVLAYIPSIDDEEAKHNSNNEGGSCQITLTSVDLQPGGRLVGTFSGVLTVEDNLGDSYNITDGKFDLKIAE